MQIDYKTQILEWYQCEQCCYGSVGCYGSVAMVVLVAMVGLSW